MRSTVYTACVVTLDRGDGPRQWIRLQEAHGYLVGYFRSVEELARTVDLGAVKIVP